MYIIYIWLYKYAYIHVYYIYDCINSVLNLNQYVMFDVYLKKWSKSTNELKLR